MIPGSSNPLLLASAAAAGGYQVSRSLRFNSSDSVYLSKSCATPSTSWTWSAWVKRSKLSDYQHLFVPRMSGYNVGLNFNNDDRLRWYDTDGTNNYNYYSTAVFRDVSAWYHIVMRVSAGAFTIYVNNTSHITGTLYQALASGTWYQGSTYYSGSPIYGLDGYLADIHFIDGQALTPSSFTEVSATTGQLIPLAYSGSFGTNGFWLKFSDNSNNTAATLGKDYSPNGNNWTPNNLSVTAGTGNDSLVDTPTSFGTDTGVGGEVRGNYATWNPVGLGGGTLSNGNLDLSTSTAIAAVGTVAMKTGKWYWEITCNTVANPRIGVFNIGASSPTGLGNDANGWCLLNSPSRTYTSSGATSYGTFSPVNGTIVNVAYDADAGKLWFGQDGSYFASGNPATGANASMSSVTGSAIVPALSSGGTDAYSVNFGQRAFAYTAPSGFKALCDTNLPSPVVAKPNTVMDVITYTGTGATQTLPNASSTPSTSLAFSPDFVWIKCRSTASTFHTLADSVRGLGSNGAYLRLFSNSTAAEVNDGYDVTALNAGGFTLTDGDYANATSRTYVAWAWDAGTSTVSNTAGSITSQVRANASAGFSVVSFTTQSSSTATVGHGLNVAPTFIIQKIRTLSADWYCYHTSIGAGNIIQLNTTAASSANSTIWNNTAPTSTVWTLGNGWAGSYSTIAYCFAPVVGYSSMGSYVGNGSSDGPMVWTGFRPKFILGKVSSTTDGWFMFDATRSPYNVANSYLAANASAAEATFTFADFLSNGFKLRATTSDWNASGQTYIYYAVAESPFQYARAR